MADLDPLIRVRKHAVEQKQKFLAELYRQAEEMEAQKRSMLDTLAEERKRVDEMGVEALGYFGNYSQAVKNRVEDIDEAMVKLNHRIDIARDEMARAFEELKKIEITQERRKAEEEKELKKKESDLMDEIALDGYRRKMEEEKG
ncbi:MAG: flagellar FliJ family protein [Alphaproteobacteria bacterium]